MNTSVKPIRFFERIKHFAAKNAVLVISAALVVISSCIIPPDSAYGSYFDYGTLCCLFSTLAVVTALKNTGFFSYTARKIVNFAGSLRSAVVLLLYITFMGSMLIANDMALITFLPLGYFVLSSTNNEKYAAITFVMQNIAANLGGMLTPFGNPQNLYLYSKFNISNTEFFGIMFPPFLLAVALITIVPFIFVKKETLVLKDNGEKVPPKRKTTLYFILFAVTILCIFRVLPYYVGVTAAVLVLAAEDKKALLQVDYSLLLTFVLFFIFAGNVSRIGVVNDLLSGLLGKNALLTSVLSCQVISNVPSSILLSNFTGDYRSLLMGVNIGGAGTLIASLASLITFREYCSHYPAEKGKYLLVFSAFNFAFLGILTLFCSTL